MIPVLILTGFLGSGKTTLLNRVLNANHGKRIGVVQNEFGSINLDTSFTSDLAEDVIEMSNGCLCCAMHDDLAEVFLRLKKASSSLDMIIVETSGLADPAPIIHALMLNPMLNNWLTPAGILCMVDAVNLDFQLEHTDEAGRQIALADTLIVSKADLVDADIVNQIRAVLSQLNPLAKQVVATNGEVDLGDVFNWAIDRSENELVRHQDHAGNNPKTHQHSHVHSSGIQSVSVEMIGSLNIDAFNTWMQSTLQHYRHELWRIKGILSVYGESDRIIIHGVHGILMAQVGDEWGSDIRKIQMVFIGKNLDADSIRNGLLMCMVEPTNGSFYNRNPEGLTRL